MATKYTTRKTTKIGKAMTIERARIRANKQRQQLPLKELAILVGVPAYKAVDRD